MFYVDLGLDRISNVLAAFDNPQMTQRTEGETPPAASMLLLIEIRLAAALYKALIFPMVWTGAML